MIFVEIYRLKFANVFEMFEIHLLMKVNYRLIRLYKLMNY